jgi:hypothetical protein
VGSQITECGVGVLFNPALTDFVSDHADSLDYLAVILDRFWIDHGLGNSPRFEDTSAGEAVLAETIGNISVVRVSITLVLGPWSAPSQPFPPPTARQRRSSVW